jgi:putative nucleotidyltransferase with HDIG domain
MDLRQNEQSAVVILCLGIESLLLDRLRDRLSYRFLPLQDPGEVKEAFRQPGEKTLLVDLDRYGWSSLSCLEADPRGETVNPVIAICRPDSIRDHQAARFFKIREFLIRPFKPVLLDMAVQRSLEAVRLRKDNQRLQEQAERCRLELVEHLINVPQEQNGPSGGSTSALPAEEVVERFHQEKRWKDLLHGEEDLQQVMDRLIELVTREWNAQRASLMLFDRSDGHLRIMKSAGLDREIVENTRVPVGRGPSGYVAKTRRPLLVKDSLDYMVANWPQRSENPCFASVPLLCAGELIGVLNVTGRRSGQEFSEQELERLTALGVIAAEALDRLILFEGLKQGYLATIQALSLAIERKDPYTCGHSSRVGQYSLAIAEEMGLEEEELEVIESAAALHDIGKILLPYDVVHKPGALDMEENEVLRQHPEIGAEMLGCLRHFRRERDIVRHHHEWWDGSGYPDGLRGGEISRCVRIVAVADAYDAMTTHRAYRRALSPDQAYEEIAAKSGIQFDPEVVRVFVHLWSMRSGIWISGPNLAMAH